MAHCKFFVLALAFALGCSSTSESGGAATGGAQGDGSGGSAGSDRGGTGGATSGGGAASGGSPTGGAATGGSGGDVMCPPCAPPPHPDCVGSGICGCGPYTCPDDEGEPCGDTVCGEGLVCCNALQGICTEPGMTCIQ